MTKLTNRVSTIPSAVNVMLKGERLLVQGPLGKNELFINPMVEIVYKDNNISTKSNNLALAGTFNSLIYNMIEGVNHGYKEVLEVKGVGYKVTQKDSKLEFALGKSHLDYVVIPSDLKVELEGNKIIITGLDKQKVHRFAYNDIKILRRPSVYKKNKGIYYLEEEKSIKLRPGKSLRK